MNWELPARVAGHMLAEHRRPDSPAAVPTDFSAELFFRRRSLGQFLLLVLGRDPAVGEPGGNEGIPSRARLRASLLRQRSGL